MNNFVQVITACQNAGGAGKKAAIQAALACADADTRSLIWHALNPYLTYGVRKWEAPTSHEREGYANASSFLDLLQALSSRSTTGNDAQAAVTNTLALYPKNVADLLELVIEKDLKAGFSEDTYNKVWAGKDDLYGTIPTFEVMLAEKCDSPEEFLEKVTFPCQGDLKYDGQRNIAFVIGADAIENRARSGKPSDHLAGLFDEDALALRAYLVKKYGHEWSQIVIDGEAFAGDFTETINAKKDGNDEAKKNLKLRVFFVMPYTHWMNQSTPITMRENRARLIEALEATKCTKLIVSEGREVKDYADMVSYCNEAIDVHKQEGLILKKWDAVYQWDRSMDWCKVKRMYDIDMQVAGWYPGRKKSRLEGTVGGLNLVGKDEHGRLIKCNVGSGFSDEQRDHIRDNWDLYFKSTAVITYQEISKAKDSDELSLRFPVVKQLLRDDKPLNYI